MIPFTRAYLSPGTSAFGSICELKFQLGYGAIGPSVCNLVHLPECSTVILTELS